MASRELVTNPGAGGCKPRAASIGVLACIVAGMAVGLTALQAEAQGLGNPRRIDAGPDGGLLVSDRSGQIVSVDPDTLEPRWAYQLPEEGAAYGLAVLGDLVLVGNTETRNVEAYLVTGGAEAGREPPGPPPGAGRGNPPPARVCPCVRSGNPRAPCRVPPIAPGPGTCPPLVFQFNLGGVPAGSKGTIERPIGVAASESSQRVLVLDAATKRVLAYDAEGTYLYQFAPADGDGEVMSPISIAVDAAGDEIWIGDYGDPAGRSSPTSPPRILIYDLIGNLLAQIDGSGFFGSNFVFARVQGLAGGSGNRIYAADPLAGRVMVFDRSTGSLLESLGTQGSLPGELMVPTDVFLSPQTGDLFIVNNRGARPVEVMRAVEVPQ